MKTKSVIYPIILSIFAAFSGCGSSSDKGTGSAVPDLGVQPYKDTGKWEWVAPIDGAGYCGPASLYHIINYYGDQGSYYYKISTDEGWVWADAPMVIPVITEEHPMFIEDTAFGLFIQPTSTGSNWAMLDDVAELYYSKDDNDPVYDTYVCSSYTQEDEIEVRRDRLDYIHENLLKKGIPVVLHLTSNIPMYGHYVDLIGYDGEKAQVYYADSLNHASGIRTVDLEDFLGQWFYDGGTYYSARWDGEWMALWHAEYATPCDQCGD